MTIFVFLYKTIKAKFPIHTQFPMTCFLKTKQKHTNHISNHFKKTTYFSISMNNLFIYFTNFHYIFGYNLFTPIINLTPLPRGTMP
jgi:hypothetical protein